MAKPLSSKVLFITTSPRTPAKMIPEINLLNEYFANKTWCKETQIEFMNMLKEENFFNGEGAKDPAFSARDRITRAPKALGFVTLKPQIQLTPAGQRLINTKQTEEVFLRQLLKFQLPSPFHRNSEKSATFRIKPYLEIFRLIRYFGSLRFDEIRIFGLQLTNYQDFDIIVEKIKIFRILKSQDQGNYKKFRTEYLHKELREIYNEEITIGDIKIREGNNDKSIERFIMTKAQNMQDYADALVRYLRATGMTQVSRIGKSVSIIPEKIKDVDYFLNHIDREPCFINDETNYTEYLGNSDLPLLLVDDKELILDKIREYFPKLPVNKANSSAELKELLDNEILTRKDKIISDQILAIKDYHFYDDIKDVFKCINDKSIYDAPLMLEWNVWRAITMLDGGNIIANLKFDDKGLPMSTAQGNMADIVCDYGDFSLSVEVTLQSGQRQYETEGEPVARHLAKLKKQTNKPTFCLFIAPQINEACIAHFYMLQKTNISYYGGKSTIIPMPLKIFIKMMEDSYQASYTPQEHHIYRLFEHSNIIAQECDDEKIWYTKIMDRALTWLEN